MNITIAEIDSNIEVARKCLSDHAGQPNEIELEILLLRGLITMLVSHIEQHIEKLFEKRVNKCNDSEVINYVTTNIHEKFRSPDIGKITQMLGKFSQDYRNAFSDQFDGTRAFSDWNNIMTARHWTVHAKGDRINLSFHEFIKTYNDTKNIFTHLEKVLS